MERGEREAHLPVAGAQQPARRGPQLARAQAHPRETEGAPVVDPPPWGRLQAPPWEKVEEASQQEGRQAPPGRRTSLVHGEVEEGRTGRRAWGRSKVRGD